MKDEEKSKTQLVEEVKKLRLQVQELERSGVELARMQEALGESEEKWRSLAETAPVIILSVNREGIIQFLNHTIGEYTPEGAIGTSVYDYVPADQRDMMRRHIERVFQTGQPGSYEILGAGAEGPATAWYETQLGPILNNGQVTAVNMVCTDITERKRMEEELRIKHNAIASSINAIALGDLEGRLSYVNDSFLKLWGYEDKSEVLGRASVDFWESKGKAREVVETLQDKGIWVGGLVAKKKDGSLFDVQLSASAITDNAGRLSCIMASFMDITERKRMEEALLESEEKFRSLVEVSSDWIWEVDCNGVYTYASPKLKELLGYEPVEIVGKRPFDFMAHDEAGRVAKLFEDIVESCKPFERLENINLHRNGQEVVLETSGVPILDSDGSLLGYRGVDRDITERKQVDEKLQEAESRLRLALLASNMGTWKWDIISNQDTRDAAFNKMLGLEQKDTTQPVEDFVAHVHPEDRPSVEAEIQRSIKEHNAYKVEFRIVRPDGEIRYLSDRGELFYDNAGRVSFMTGAVVDITERKGAEEKIKQAAEEWSDTFDAISELVFIQDKDFKFVKVNKSVCDTLKVKAEDLIGKKCYEVLHKSDKHWPNCPSAKTLKDKRPHTEEVYDPNIGIPLLISTSPLFDKKGELTGTIHVITDLTERKRAEEALREQARRHEAILQAAVDGFTRAGLDGELLEVNAAFCKMSGYSREELLGMRLEYLEAAETGEEVKEHIEKIMRGGYDRFQTRHRRKDGKIVDVEVSTQFCKVGEEGVFFSFYRDITDLKRIQEELEEYRENMLRAERLASLGTLSATLAHELTQPLTVANLSVENSLDELAKTSCPDSVTETLKESVNQLSNAASIIDRFRNFARKTSHKAVSELNLGVIGEKMVDLLSKSASRGGMTLQLEGLDKLPPIYCNENDAEQVFFSLIQNAIEAAADRESRRLTISGSVKDDNIELRFADDCGGIAPENVDKIFEPFFTTRPAGQGTGLGLCIVQEIVSRYGGQVSVDNKYGRGATFCISLPTKFQYD